LPVDSPFYNNRTVCVADASSKKGMFNVGEHMEVEGTELGDENKYNAYVTSNLDL